MDEEFFFPQNVRTEYRLWLMGPRHLRRLAVAPVVALGIGWPLSYLSLYLAAASAALALACYAALCCLPLVGEADTLWDVFLEIRRHRRGQRRYLYAEGGGLR